VLLLSALRALRLVLWCDVEVIRNEVDRTGGAASQFRDKTKSAKRLQSHL